MSPARRIAAILIGFAVVLGGLLTAQVFGFGEGYRLLADGDKPKPKDYLGGLSKDAFQLPAWADYHEVIERPVFNDDRKPTPIEDKPVAETKEGTVNPLDVTLTSIIHSGQTKLAIVRDNKSNESMVVKVGMPLEGEQNAWKLVEVSPRKAVFEAQDQGRQELELAVNEAAIERVGGANAPTSSNPVPNQQVAMQQPNAAPPDAPESEAASQARAEEIRRRIEERRKQLREEAERMRAQESSQ